jgi:hypothetical protein
MSTNQARQNPEEHSCATVHVLPIGLSGAMHCPFAQVSPICEQVLPLAELLATKAVVLRLGSHDWQGLLGFVAPAARQAFAIKHP